MNHPAGKVLEEKVEAVLEVVSGKGTSSNTSLIYASRINGNESWRYVRGNGQVLWKNTDKNPEEMRDLLMAACFVRGEKGYVKLGSPEDYNHKSYSQK